jgi:hypothetical protein
MVMPETPCSIDDLRTLVHTFHKLADAEASLGVHHPQFRIFTGDDLIEISRKNVRALKWLNDLIDTKEKKGEALGGPNVQV